ncbi:hypothetical protein DPMN_049654 [Dreissena polymorpha]|uniref:Uncharacterized protein n=1 Tax=Dreissena polymorpha TaxID=45954 RepID=A0A9D4CEQ9_DREPO|nr:hypothetical protein DPMN_049654 [Dreissena polymorpha]
MDSIESIFNISVLASEDGQYRINIQHFCVGQRRWTVSNQYSTFLCWPAKMDSIESIFNISVLASKDGQYRINIQHFCVGQRRWTV